MQLKRPPQRAAMGGFSLVELMVASVIGLIVVGAVMALVLSMMRSNRQTLQSTRLNQELRATLAVVANDLKRARSVEDPFTVATAAAGNVYETIDTATPGCIRYSYANGAGGDWRSVYRDANSNRIVLTAAGAQASATCASAGAVLGSPQVAVTAFDIQQQASSTTNRRYDITISGRLVDPDSQLSTITRTLRQTVFVRSLGDGS